MNYFKTAKWIWAQSSLDIDDYAEFCGTFSSIEPVTIKIACDSVYAFYINDELIKFMKCSDYPELKFVDIFNYQPTKKDNSFKIMGLISLIILPPPMD